MSETYSFLKSCYDLSKNCSSWERINDALDKSLKAAILLEARISAGDVKKIASQFKWRFWAGTSENGHHYGECYYELACKYHVSFAQAYEADFKRVPFLIRNKRLYCGSRLSNGLYWRVTGWTEDNKNLNLVGYANRRGEGKRSLLKLDRKAWLDFRKGVVVE